MSAEISVLSVVKYETRISYYDSFTVRFIKVTDRKGHVTEVSFFHTEGDLLDQPPTEIKDNRTQRPREGTFNADVEATL
jgi:hypothetical protein